MPWLIARQSSASQDGDASTRQSSDAACVRLPRIERGLVGTVCARVRAAHISDLKAVAGKVKRVRFQELEPGHLVASEVRQPVVEVAVVQRRDACAKSSASARKAFEQLGNAAVEIRGRIAVDQVS